MSRAIIILVGISLLTKHIEKIIFNKNKFDDFEIGKLIKNDLIEIQELTEEEYKKYLNLLSIGEDYSKAEEYLKEVLKK